MESRRNRDKRKPLPDNILLEEVVRGLVSDPGAVQVEDNRIHERTSHLVIIVAPFDRGKIIGKQGKTIEAIRSIFMAMASLQGRKVFIEVDEPHRYDRDPSHDGQAA